MSKTNQIMMQEYADQQTSFLNKIINDSGRIIIEQEKQIELLKDENNQFKKYIEKLERGSTTY